MDMPMCSKCMTGQADLVILPDANPEIQIDYNCTECYSGFQAFGYQAFPYHFITVRDGFTVGNLDKLGEKCTQIIENLHKYKNQVQEESEIARSRYIDAFDLLFRNLQMLKDKVLADLRDGEATERERIDAVIQDVNSVRGQGWVGTEVAYLAGVMNRKEREGQPDRFVTYSEEEIRGYVEGVFSFPIPRMTPRTYRPTSSKPSNFDSGSLARHSTIVKRLIEDQMLLMPIDTHNVIIADFTGLLPQRRIISFKTPFPYRVHARWCRVDGEHYVYTGGLVKGEPVKWCDLMDTSQFNAPAPCITWSKALDMGVARHRHAVICHDRKVYAFGGVWQEPNVNNSQRAIEQAVSDGNWTTAEWRPKGNMDNIQDVTATVLKNVIYLAGSCRYLYQYDIARSQFSKLTIQSIMDLDNLSPRTEEVVTRTAELTLPRQSSKSLILAWESRIVVLQHGWMFSFTPGGERVEMRRKKVTTVKPWCSPFPAVVKESKSYFILEPTETELMPVGDVWMYDFINATVSLTSFD